jgi:formylglycine-generating enzyme required for sulfatase activity
MKRILFWLFNLILPLSVFAQASGGQITRKPAIRTNTARSNVKPIKDTFQSYDTKPMDNKICSVNGIQFYMIGVQGGTFEMGATSEQGSESFLDEKPIHKVAISSFYIGETEVTQELWYAVMGNNPSRFKGNSLPVECVDWSSCQQFISKLNSLTNMNFRLPTEAEWEYVSRGGRYNKKYKYSGSSLLNDVAWFSDNSNGKTHSVKSKNPNELGVYDMSGNVQEWCGDYYSPYMKSSQTNPQGPNNGLDWRKNRIIRGGSCNDLEYRCRICVRFDMPEINYYNEFTGFRLAYSE